MRMGRLMNSGGKLTFLLVARDVDLDVVPKNWSEDGKFGTQF